MKERLFALYKGEKFIDIGTAKELAKKRNVKPETIHFLSTPANLRKIERRKNKDKPSNAMVCVKILEEEDEN